MNINTNTLSATCCCCVEKKTAGWTCLNLNDFKLTLKATAKQENASLISQKCERVEEELNKLKHRENMKTRGSDVMFRKLTDDGGR